MDHMAARALTPIYRIPHAGRKIGVHFSFLSRDDLHLWQQSLPRRPQVLSGARKYRHAYVVLHPLLLPITLAITGGIFGPLLQSF